MLILQIDSSSDLCSVALSQNGQLLEMQINQETFQHGRDINILIESLFENSEYKLNDIDAVSVNQGPGSFTALRIGMATAKGICFGLDVPLLTPNGLEILVDYARQKYPEADEYIPMIDARRMEVYTSSSKKEDDALTQGHALILSTESFSKRVNDRLCFVGDAFNKWNAIWPPSTHWIGEQVSIDAGKMTRISYQLLKSGNISNLFTSTPLYIKKPNITTSKKVYFN